MKFILLHLLFGHSIYIKTANIISFAQPNHCVDRDLRNVDCSLIEVQTGHTPLEYQVLELPDQICKLIKESK